MTRIAIGNDFNVRWSLSQLGQPYNLAGKSITITLKSAYSEQDITDILVSGNVITFMFPAEMQIYIAKYDIILRIEASSDTWTVKLCDAFELVACGSCAYITQDDCNVTTITTDGQTIEFESQIVYPSNGMSAYELAKASGEYTGDYEGYQKWLAGLNGGGGGSGVVSADEVYIFEWDGESDSGTLSEAEVAKLFAAKYIVVSVVGVIIPANVISLEDDACYIEATQISQTEDGSIPLQIFNFGIDKNSGEWNFKIRGSVCISANISNLEEWGFATTDEVNTAIQDAVTNALNTAV